MPNKINFKLLSIINFIYFVCQNRRIMNWYRNQRDSTNVRTGSLPVMGRWVLGVGCWVKPRMTATE
jgi:hypothetical protein